MDSPDTDGVIYVARTEDNLLDMVHHLGSKKRIMMDVPITYSFFENQITGIVGDSAATKRFMDNLVLQMMINNTN